jgi:hypothetical protein
MGTLAAVVIAVVAGLILAAVLYVRFELRGPATRPVPVLARAAMQRARGARRVRVAPGDDCVCGGTIGRTGRASARFGELLGCTGCRRSWTADGRRIIRRRPRGPRQDQPPRAA